MSNCTMESLVDGVASLPKTHNPISTVHYNPSFEPGSSRPPHPPTRHYSRFEGPSSSSYDIEIDHPIKTNPTQTGSVITSKQLLKSAYNDLQKDGKADLLRHQIKSNKGKKELLDDDDDDDIVWDEESAEGGFQKEVSQTNGLLRPPSDNLDKCNSSCPVKSEGNTSLSTIGGAIELLNSQLRSQSANGYCPSPQNSFYSAAQYIEAKPSFTNTEFSGRASSVEKSGESGEVSNSYEFVESRKTSIYRGSSGSDVSEESSTSSFSSSAMYKPHKANDIRWEAIRAVKSRHGGLNFNNFRLLKPLGCGDIGSVYLSELTGTRTYFAMKVMDKSALESRKKLVRAQTEREILQSLDHPFLPTLYTHFETEKHSCLVMEFCPGGDLHALRQRQPGKCFPEHAARFYVAEVLLALEYLHMLGIIYRDLKPENVLVREDGHIMLSDFDLSLRCAVSPTLVKSSNSSSESKNSGYCAQPACIEPSCVIQPACIQPACFGPRFFGRPKKEKKSKPKTESFNQGNTLPELLAEPTNARSMSFVGTHEYLAPEIIKGEGHGSAVDWWTFGIFLYELLFGRTPFKGQGNRATLFNVVGQPLRFPHTSTVSFAARDLIRGLLVKEPQHRLAYRRGATEIKQHPFFQSINWALIRCASPPDVPRPYVLHDLPRGGAPTAGKVPSVDVKPSDNYLEIDFF